jgi:biotin carboxyl carrier protein
VNDEYLQLEEKAAEAPELAWRAVQGLAGEKHAKAISDYARAENERIDLALKKRVLEDKVRQERAIADKLEADAAVAKLNELIARAELARAVRDLGVVVTVNKSGAIRVEERNPQSPIDDSGLFTLPEKRLLGLVIDVTAPKFDFAVSEMSTVVLTKWLCEEGQSVRRDEPIFEISSDVLDAEIPCPVDGRVLQLLVAAGAEIKQEQTVVCRIEKS